MLFWGTFNHLRSQRQACKTWAVYWDQMGPVLSELAGVYEWVFTLKALLRAGIIKQRPLVHPASSAVKSCTGAGTGPRADSASAPPPSPGSSPAPLWSWLISLLISQMPCKVNLLKKAVEKGFHSAKHSSRERNCFTTAIPHSFGFNRYDKGYCMLFIILICCSFMLLSKTCSADRGTSRCLLKIQ